MNYTFWNNSSGVKSAERTKLVFLTGSSFSFLPSLLSSLSLFFASLLSFFVQLSSPSRIPRCTCSCFRFKFPFRFNKEWIRVGVKMQSRKGGRCLANTTMLFISEILSFFLSNVDANLSHFRNFYFYSCTHERYFIKKIVKDDNPIVAFCRRGFKKL